jgi:hypothetical protein
LKTILTTTGVDNETTILQKGTAPDLVVGGLDALVDFWQLQLEEGRDECS